MPTHRGHFSLGDRIREAINVPWRHFKGFFEPDGINYVPSLPGSDRLYGNTAMSFSAYLTNNSIELNQWHEMDITVHSQFGTVDNPVLIFTSDSSWRVVICQGPGVEDDSHAHEKMFYMLREGPINRCQICGQCFKLVRLKDEFSELQDYYSLMFSQLSTFEVQEDDVTMSLASLFYDRQIPSMQAVPSTNVYIHVNSDEADHLMVDPAYRLEKFKEAHERLYALYSAYQEVDRQLFEGNPSLQVTFARDLYESWYAIEKSILKLDRWFAKIEKFNHRKLNDYENHERRENRMLQRKRERWAHNYTFFSGSLTEEEQMYRDYFESDIEEDPEDEKMEELNDEFALASSGEFRHKNFDFVETGLKYLPHENAEDLVETKIFKYKYRLANDLPDKYVRRMGRVVDRFLQRSESRPNQVRNHHHLIYLSGVPPRRF